MLNSTGKLILTAAIALLVGFCIQVILPYGNQPTHGSGPYLLTKDPLVLKGQEVYRQEGCFYCHTKDLRSIQWEVERFSDASKLGYFPLPDPVEYRFHSPNMRGSQRIGPDLSRLATKMDEVQLRAFLQSDSAEAAAPSDEASVGTPGSRYHQFSGLFNQEYDQMDGVALSWRIRAMMQAGFPMNDPYQKASEVSVIGKTRGDALVAFLLSLGSDAQTFTGSYFQ